METSARLRFPCLIVDHDDTSVASTAAIHYPAHVASMRRLRPAMAPIGLEGWFLKNSDPGLMGYLVGELGYNPEEIAANTEIWRSFTSTRTAPFFPGFLALLADFRRQGGRIAVVSHSETEKIIRDYIADTSLGEPFLPDVIIGWQEEARLRKPGVYPVQAVMERFCAAPEQVLVLDDLKPGRDMAIAAGVSCAGAGWGHDVAAIRSVMREQCHWYFRTIEAFRQFLLGTEHQA